MLTKFSKGFFLTHSETFPSIWVLWGMLDPEIFLDLPLRQKIKVLYEHGSFVVAIRYYGYKINLYLVGKYYVEVFYNHKLDCIEKIELMNPHHSRIKFYTDQINLPKNML